MDEKTMKQIETVKRFINDPYGTACVAFPSPKKVIFNYPATIVFWNDKTKTVVKCCNLDEWDPEKGLAMAFMKKLFGNTEAYHQVFKKFCPEIEHSERCQLIHDCISEPNPFEEFAREIAEASTFSLNEIAHNIFGGNR